MHKSISVEMDAQAQQSELANMLAAKQGRDARVFAHATAETQSHINGNFNNSRPVTRCTPMQEPGFLEVFPRVASRPPRLLQDLEAQLVDRLRANDKAASTLPLLSKDRDPKMSANLTLEANQHVLMSFVSGFSSFTELLSSIMEEFNAALDEGLRCTHENVRLRDQIAEEKEKRFRACADATAKVMAGELEYRKAAFARLQELKLRVTRAVKRASAMEKELKEVQEEEARINSVVDRLKATQASLSGLKQAETVWATKPTSTPMGTMSVGPLTEEDRAWLDAEYVCAADLATATLAVPAAEGEEATAEDSAAVA